jgi:hypothetical protein
MFYTSCKQYIWQKDKNKKNIYTRHSQYVNAVGRVAK